jgi:uncharacterized repeat protein (TIGR01451 family)
MLKKITHLFLLCLLSVSFSMTHLTAQTQDLLPLAKSYLDQKYPGLTKQADIDWIITDQSTNARTQVTYLYLRQTQQGIEIVNANINMAIKNGVVVHQTGKIISKIKQKELSKSPNISAEGAIQRAAEQLSLSISEPLTQQQNKNPNSRATIYSEGGISLEPIPTKMVYWQNAEGKLVLAWDLSIYPLDQENWWSLRIDAQTGTILEKGNWVTKCQFDPIPHVHTQKGASNTVTASSLIPNWVNHQIPTPITGEQYNVFAYPIESPNHGTLTIEANPFNAGVSPFGWHDTNGTTGAEFTITRGNNVHAYEDRNNLNTPGFSPDGGASLNFDFPIDFDTNPDVYQSASITNLFYWNNIIHDVFSFYGFDEQSGNFQSTNYSGQGIGNDDVRAEDQDGSGTNNANFGTPPEGSRPRMQMFLWSSGGGGFQLIINSPSTIAGTYTAAGANFGGSLDAPLTGDLVLVNDGTTNPNEGCNALLNSVEVGGKIAIVDRGNCTFVQKVTQAQNAGAIGVIVVNNVAGNPTTLGGTDASITIPAIMVSQATGILIKNNLPGVNATMNDDTRFISSSLDNGIIVHEYGHGISNRLTGGPSNSGCLGTTEQMGEGWSDYFGLILTIKAGDVGTTPRGIGTYAVGQPITGGGIRPAPYTTNMSINPFTYANLGSSNISQPHGIGFIWCSTIWDMTWLFIERYGFDEDVYEGTGGNNIALQLVMDGLKLQPCGPGFIDGRDAILLADQLNNGGANQDIIWEAFSGRGLGADADQGDPNDRNDGSVSFEMPKNLQITKSVDKSFAETGDILTYQITVKNILNETELNILVEDILDAGLTLVDGSLSTGGSIDGNVIRFTKNQLAAQESVTFSFQAEITQTEGTQVLFLDDQENGADNWTSTAITNTNQWTLQGNNPNGGSNAWFVRNAGSVSLQNLTLDEAFPIGLQSELAIWHSYNTEADYDGGVIEISTDGGVNWNSLGALMMGNGYNSTLSNEFDNPIGGRDAFSGNSNGYVRTVINLSSFAGQSARIRFRFGSDAGVGGEGWYIDEVYVYEGNEESITNEACLTYTGEPTPLCAFSSQTTILAEVVVSDCPANAGLISTSLALPIVFCQDDASVLDFDKTYNALNPNPGAGFAHRFLITTNEIPYQIIARNSDGNFDPSALAVGTFRIWGLSYDETNPETDIDTYLNSFTTIQAIQAGINSGVICAKLSDQFEGGTTAQITKSSCTALPSVQSSTKIDYYPNPSSEEVNISIKAHGGQNATIQLLNTQGQAVYQESFKVLDGDFIKTINLKRFSAGLYLIKISLDNQTYQGRLVIE